MSDEQRYISIPDPTTADYPEGVTPEYPTGSRVKVSGDYPGMIARGLPSGTLGTVTGWGRSHSAHKQFTDTSVRAETEGRDLTDDDFECLIDNEGPAVKWDNGIEDWFPGQAITTIEYTN